MANIQKKDGGQQQGERGELVRFEPFQMMRDLMGWDPFQMFGTMPMMRGRRSGDMMWSPNIEIRENKDGYVFKCDVPGLKPEELDVSVTGDRLQISGKREQEQDQTGEEGTYHTYERSYGSFCRMFTLPENADIDQIRSSLDNGVLTLVVPKKAGSTPQQKKIQISSGARSKS